jgi:hypothetical protein
VLHKVEALKNGNVNQIIQRWGGLNEYRSEEVWSPDQGTGEFFKQGRREVSRTDAP